MPKIKLERVVSCSSEDPDHSANHLLNSETKQKWKNKSTGESSASVIFQLEKSSKISGIDIGNENSSFVEVLVGRSSSQEQDYQIILPMSSLMTPIEARNLSNNNRVRMFTYEDLSSSVRDEKWDRVKVVCTQPFNKHVQYGLSFITLHTPKEQKQDNTNNTTLGKFTIRPESPDILSAGSLFAKRKELLEDDEPENNITVTQAIKTSEKPKCKPVKIIQPSSSSKAPSTAVEEKNRKRRALFYDSDEEEPNEKIDKIVEKAKAEEEKKKETKTSNNTKKKIDDNGKNSPKAVSSAKKETKKVVNNSPSTSKRKTDTPVKTVNKKRKVVTKPFHQLLSGVVFTISGIVNPERANLRTKALTMGAKYRPDWDNTCTHLICAFANTPKFTQVQGKGKIVKKSWITDCFDQRKHLPWRRFALDRNDQGKSESEDEIEEAVEDSEKEDSPPPTKKAVDNNDKIEINDKKPIKLSNQSDYLSGSDTDDEIEKILAKQKKEATNNNKTIKDKVKDDLTDPFNIDTEPEDLTKNSADIEEIPKLFSSEIFYIDDVFDDDEKKKLQRLIKGFDGVVLTSLRNIVDFVITNEDSVESIKKRSENVKCVSCSWIYECQDILKRVPHEKFLL